MPYLKREPRRSAINPTTRSTPCIAFVTGSSIITSDYEATLPSPSLNPRVAIGQDGLLPLYEPSTTSSVSASISVLTGSDDGDNSESDGSGGGMSLGVIVPVSTVLGLLVIVLLILIFIPRRKSFLQRLSLPRSSNSPVQPRAANSSSQSTRALALTRTVTAEELTGTTSRQNGTTASSTEPTTRGRALGPRGRALRRTESGRSIRTLPKYSKEAGDEELVLVRHRSQSAFSEDLSDEEEVRADNDDRLLPSSASAHVLAIQNHDTHVVTDEVESTVSLLPPNTAVRNLNDEDTHTPHTAPLPNGDVPRPQASMIGAIARRGWGEAPTYLEAMSSPSLLFPGGRNGEADVEAGLPAVQPQTIRTRTSSTFREFLQRTGFAPLATRGRPHSSRNNQMGEHRRAHSSTSLLLQPQSSRLSSSSAQHSRVGSPYNLASPSQSAHSLVISSPIPHTAVRASFDSTTLPKAGLSDQQMRFLSSNEAVNLAGIRLEDVPANRKKRRRSEVPTLGDDIPPSDGELGLNEENSGAESPPSWNQIEEQRRRNEAWERRNLAKPVLARGPQDDPAAEPGRQLGNSSINEGGSGNLAERSDRGAEIHQASGSAEARDNTRLSPTHVLSVTNQLPQPIPTPTFEVEPPTPTTASIRERVPSTTNTIRTR